MVDGNSGNERSAKDILGENLDLLGGGVASTQAALGGASRVRCPTVATIQRLQEGRHDPAP